LRLDKSLKITSKLKLALAVRLIEVMKEQSAIQGGQDSDRKKEARAASDPALTVKGKTSGRYNAMKVRMEHQGLSPGVKQGEEANPCAKVLGIGSDAQEGLGDGAEQQIVNHPRISQRQHSKRIRQGEHDVIVSDREQLLLTSFKPPGFSQRLALGTVSVATRVVDRHPISAARALVEMTAKRRCSTLHDRAHHPALLSSDEASVLLEESFPVPTDDIGDFKRWW